VQAADVVILVPPDDSAAERQRFVLVVWLARTYAVCGHTCPSAESRREFGIGADDCVSSTAGADRVSRRVPRSCAMSTHPANLAWEKGIHVVDMSTTLRRCSRFARCAAFHDGDDVDDMLEV
jgi:hypothetical protein